MKAQVDGVRQQRETTARGRDRRLYSTVAIVGYTNAGKSTLLNALVGSVVAKAEDKLFATLDPTSRQVKLGDGQTVIVTDTVGFIHKLPHQLVDAFRATLGEVTRADVLVEVVDASDAHATEHRATVQTVLEELGAGDKPRLTAFNKADLVYPNTDGKGPRPPWPIGACVRRDRVRAGYAPGGHRRAARVALGGRRHGGPLCRWRAPGPGARTGDRGPRVRRAIGAGPWPDGAVAGRGDPVRLPTAGSRASPRRAWPPAPARPVVRAARRDRAARRGRAKLTWTVADGTRGRRWRSVTTEADGGLVLGLLVEVAAGRDGGEAREASAPGGLLTLHPEVSTLLGNVVRAGGGVERLALPFTEGRLVLVDRSSVGGGRGRVDARWTGPRGGGGERGGGRRDGQRGPGGDERRRGASPAREPAAGASTRRRAASRSPSSSTKTASRCSTGANSWALEQAGGGG